ncbi:MAG TPA: hypothetical protein VLM40_09860 [Gemmata sp.]|nr:hypothetical protein [Gemmata sp.]
MTRVIFAAAAILASLSGCAQVKEVSYDPQTGTGVVAIPSNGGIWDGMNRRAASALIEKRVGPNYSIVGEEQVVTGRQTVNNQNTNSDPNFLNQSVTNTTTTQDLTELQIRYQKKPTAGALGSRGTNGIQQTRYLPGSGPGVTQAGGIVPSAGPGVNRAGGITSGTQGVGSVQTGGCADGSCAIPH